MQAQAHRNGSAALTASATLQQLQVMASKDNLTLDWLTARLGHQSFGFTILMLALASMAPGISYISGALLLIAAFQMMIGLSTLAFPKWIGTRKIPADRFDAVVRRAVPGLRWVERILRQRWPTPPQATKHIVGAVIVLLTIRLLLAPLPLSNIPPALLISLVSLAYVEKDGAVLWVSTLLALLLIVIDVDLIWKLIHGARSIILPKLPV